MLSSSDVHPLPPSRPSNGGQDCPGVNYEYQLCNTDDCPKHFEDFRAQQCQLRNSHFEFQNAKHHWLPYEHPDGAPKKCQPIVLFRVRLLCFLKPRRENNESQQGHGLCVLSARENNIIRSILYIQNKDFPNCFRQFPHTNHASLCRKSIFYCVLCLAFRFFSCPSFPLFFFSFDSLTQFDSLSQ